MKKSLGMVSALDINGRDRELLALQAPKNIRDNVLTALNQYNLSEFQFFAGRIRDVNASPSPEFARGNGLRIA